MKQKLIYLFLIIAIFSGYGLDFQQPAEDAQKLTDSAEKTQASEPDFSSETDQFKEETGEAVDDLKTEEPIHQITQEPVIAKQQGRADVAKPGEAFNFQQWAKDAQKKLKDKFDQLTKKKPSENVTTEKKSSRKWFEETKKSEFDTDSETNQTDKTVGGTTNISQIQKQIRQLTEQTKIAEQQGLADRAKLKKVIEQAQMQTKLVESLQTPRPVVASSHIDANEILRQEKLRLIAQDVQKTQEALRAAKPVSTVTTPVAPVKTRKWKNSRQA